MNRYSTPVHGEARVLASDGHPLGATWFPADDPRAVVVILGATATPQRYYARFAAWLAAEGFTTLTVDYRGVGASRPDRLRGFAATMRDWGELDAEAAVRAGQAAARGLPVLVVAHSFGGQALALSDAYTEVDGLLAVGAQLGSLTHWPWAQRLRLSAGLYGVMPVAVSLFGYWPGWTGIGADLPAGVARQWAAWCASPGYLLDHVPEAAARLRSYTGALEIWGFTDDLFAAPAAVRAYADAVRPTGRVLRIREPEAVGARSVGHFGPFRPSFADRLWPEMGEVLGGFVQAAPR